MTGDCHVQFCEGLWVKLPRSTLSIPLKVQKLQTALHVRAKENPGFRFYALYDKVYREDILQFAYSCCKANGGAAGWTNRGSRTSRRTGGIGGWGNWRRSLERRGIDLKRYDEFSYRSGMQGFGPWAFPRSATGRRRWQRCWS